MFLLVNSINSLTSPTEMVIQLLRDDWLHLFKNSELMWHWGLAGSITGQLIPKETLPLSPAPNTLNAILVCHCLLVKEKGDI